MCVGGLLVGQGVKKVGSISCGGGGGGGSGGGVSEASRRQSGPRAGKKTRRAAN